jgi:hypothetical protein
MEHIAVYESSQDACSSPDHNCDGHTDIASHETIIESSKKRRLDENHDTSHQGRIRSFPHVEGQFATHVYFEVDLPENSASLRGDYSQLVQTLETACQGISSLHHIEMPLHVSLSRTVPIRSIQIGSLLKGLQQTLTQNLKKNRSLDVRIGGSADVLLNDEKTRTFITLPVSDKGEEKLKNIIDRVSKVFVLHGLPKYYEDPIVHASFVWCLGDHHDAIIQLLQNSKAVSHMLQRLQWESKITRICCRIGKKDHIIWHHSFK